MATRRYAKPASARSGDTAARVLDAADALVRSGSFHTATVDDLAERAGVARATVFAKFGSRLGVLDALYARCASSSESEALRMALDIEDPLEALAAAIPAGCRSWEAWGALHQHLRAIVVLEAEVRPLVERQRRFHHEALYSIARRLDQRGLLRERLTPERAAVAMHMLTGLEAFIELRHDGKLSLDQTIETIDELVHALLRPA